MGTQHHATSSVLLNPLPYGAPFQGARRYPLYPAPPSQDTTPQAQTYDAPLPWASGEESEAKTSAPARWLH